MRIRVLAEGEGPTISTTLPARRGRRWNGGGNMRKGRSVRILLSACAAVSSAVIHENAGVIFLGCCLWAGRRGKLVKYAILILKFISTSSMGILNIQKLNTKTMVMKKLISTL